MDTTLALRVQELYHLSVRVRCNQIAVKQENMSSLILCQTKLVCRCLTFILPWCIFSDHPSSATSFLTQALQQLAQFLYPNFYMKTHKQYLSQLWHSPNLWNTPNLFTETKYWTKINILFTISLTLYRVESWLYMMLDTECSKMVILVITR